MLFYPLWDTSAPRCPLTYNQDHSCMTLCFLQSDPYPRAYSRIEACLDPHISPDQNLPERENKRWNIDLVILIAGKHGLCHYVIRLKQATWNQGELKKVYLQQNTKAWVNMRAAVSEPFIIHADLKLLQKACKSLNRCVYQGMEFSLHETTVIINTKGSWEYVYICSRLEAFPTHWTSNPDKKSVQRPQKHLRSHGNAFLEVLYFFHTKAICLFFFATLLQKFYFFATLLSSTVVSFQFIFMYM